MKKIKAVLYWIYGFTFVVPLVLLFKQKSPNWLVRQMLKFGTFLEIKNE